MRFQILGSSSSGNCALLETDDTCILIDAGFSGRKLKTLLRAAGRSVDDLHGVFITHEHGDHATGVKGLSQQRPDLPFFANYDTAQAVQRPLKRDVRWVLFETHKQFKFRDLEITSCLIPHDAYEPVAYTFATGGHDLFNPYRKLAWITDLGHTTDHVRELAADADVLVLESNHDPDLLANDPFRPYSVKARISGQHGHLSNEAAASFLQSFHRPRWRHLYLAHLSKDCNEPDRVDHSIRGAGCRCAHTVVDPTAPAQEPLDLLAL
ncbi:MAG: beta-lactamase domain-containing protein [Puniceicoccaceae bacterium 5H]|nr:MAG: beta-lactamase domain-containing protein [Puniceicoccaceae bacterium 5H]